VPQRGAGVHGYQASPNAERLARLAGADALLAKLDSNEGRYGPLPGVVDLLELLLPRLNRYPDQALELVERLAARHDIEPDRILLGNGADAIVGHLCAAYLEPGDEAVMGWPSFVTYRGDTLLRGATPVLVPLTNGAYDVGAMLERIGPRTKLAFVCNPNNPTGGIVTREQLGAFVDAVPDRVLVVVDEAYHEYVDHTDYPDTIVEHVLTRPNVAVLRTFSKIFGLAGLRVGYLVAAPTVVETASRHRHWFDVTDLAHVAAAESLAFPGDVAERRERTIVARATLAGMLRNAGLRPQPSYGNFVYAEVRDGVAVAAQLARKGVLIRSLEAFGAPGAIRVTVGTDAEMQALESALAGMTFDPV
jgi:histidinol-phosphate aminotransferase